jgi:hypothetical protein
MNDMRPPTDNLYKFLAIFGLIVVGFSIYIPLQRLEAFSRSNVLIDSALWPMFDRQDVLMDYVNARHDCLIEKEKNNGQATKPGACKELLRKKAAADAATADLVNLRRQLEPLEMERNFLYQQYVMYSRIGIVLGCIGAILCVVGFWLWYVRLQKFLDEAMRREASSAGRSQRRTFLRSKARK